METYQVTHDLSKIKIKISVCYSISEDIMWQLFASELQPHCGFCHVNVEFTLQQLKSCGFYFSEDGLKEPSRDRLVVARINGNVFGLDLKKCMVLAEEDAAPDYVKECVIAFYSNLRSSGYSKLNEKNRSRSDQDQV